jgi:hypothetical protein
MSNQLVNRQLGDPPVADSDGADTIKAASVPVRIQIFNQAQKISSNRDADDYDSKIEGVISVFKGLIANDPNNIFHRNHSELSEALRRKKPPDLQGAADEITKAIEIRDKLGKKGWRFYEFHRARCRIERIPNYRGKPTADAALTDLILGDLRTVYSEIDAEKWNRWCTSDSSVRQWMNINKIDEGKLRQL